MMVGFKAISLEWVWGDMVHIDMQFGNHGNTRTDFKIWGFKWDKTKSTFTYPQG
jgi:hypothetical protein